MNLDILRKKIDAIDRKIIRLLEQRLDLARNIGKIKRMSKISIVDNDREEFIKKRINKLSPNNQSVKNIFETILKESKSLQKSTP
ncbi:chorismate mutase [Candidatus Gottesmanbacteria bacterium]|nr:chorismate mutase [Candidatus Gottesmanbacteria bacterium]